jgi:alpha-N-arabinofuranosidase
MEQTSGKSRSEIILIGPIGAGKSTQGKLLAEKLGLPQRAMDDLRWAYYKEIGYDEELSRQIGEKEGFPGVYRYWKRFEIHAVERLLAEHRDCVIDFGAGHSVYEDEALFERARRALEPFRNVVLLLPSPDLEESVRLLRERTGTEPGGEADGPLPIDFCEHFVRHPSNHRLATIVVYTDGKSPEEIRDEILERTGSGEHSMAWKAPEIVTFVSGEPAWLEVFAGERAAQPITPRLFGKFTEHLGRNIYHGMWAQVLVNPGFEPLEHFLWRGEARDALAHGLVRGDFSREQAEPVLQRLVDSLRNGVAWGWTRHGEGDVRYSLDTDRVSSDTSQRIEVRSLDTPEVGVAQPIFLPLHRTREFVLTVQAKGSGRLRVGVRADDRGSIADRRSTIDEAILGPLSEGWRRYEVRLTVDADGGERGELLWLTVGLTAPGTVWLDQCFLFPADAVDGFDADVVRLCQEARLPLLRYPGGNFVSGYHWEEGVGPVDARPMRRNPAWANVPEYNHVGTDEFMAFCAAVGCEPMICVNAGDGTPEEAARWLEYCNGGPETPQGRRRAENGHPEPYGVRFWEIGNELWGDWQIGHCTPEEYPERYRRFYEAMKAVDPTIEIIACGQDARWNEPVIEQAADILRSLSIHTLIAHRVPPETDPETVYRSVMAFPAWYEGHLKELAEQMARKVTPPRIAITELQIMTRARPNNQTIAEALYLAGIINTSIRLGDLVELINHTALVNHGGGLRKEREFVWENPVHLTSRLYANQSGRWPVRLRVTSPVLSVPELHDLPAVTDAPYLDAVALLNDAGDELTLLVTNRHPSEALTAEIALHDFSPQAEVATQTIAGESFLSENSFTEPNAVRLEPGRTTASQAGLRHTFPAHSVTALSLRRTT